MADGGGVILAEHSSAGDGLRHAGKLGEGDFAGDAEEHLALGVHAEILDFIRNTKHYASPPSSAV